MPAAKETLSSRAPDEALTIACTYDGITHQVALSRRQFEELTRSLLDQTADKRLQLVERAFSGGKSWAKVDVILLVGGSTKMPCVPAMLEEMTGIKPKTSRGVDLNVARGAAYIAFNPDAWTNPPPGPDAQPGGTDPSTDAPPLDPDTRSQIEMQGPKGGGKIVVRDVANYSVGVAVWDDRKQQDVNHVLIKKSSPTQTPCVQTFYTFEKDQAFVDLVLYRGDGEELNTPERSAWGRCALDNLPPGPAGQPIRVTLCYDGSGLISGEGVHTTSGKRVEIKVSLDALAVDKQAAAGS